ncbi:MAG: hypothetical protein M3R64_12975 [Pseudomonadota bacterium]|nr:hypothetical protein [Pseudomonadota bacterium]
MFIGLIAPEMPRPLPLHLLGVASALAFAMPGGASAAICGLALCGALVAALDRRHGAMLAALGIAIGLGAAGLLLAPLIIGVTIRRRAWRALPLVPITGGATWLTVGPWSTGPTLPTLAAAVSEWPSLFAMGVAAGVAFATWIAADASSAGASIIGRKRFVLIALLGGALFVPTPVAALSLPLLLVVATESTGRPRHRAANDNQPVRRIGRLAA